ncbi:MAG: PIN domain-containing protein [Phycisphaerae bacterium]|nr:PIN domain-containing protein [Phycisphaerae bacterium]
MLNLFIDTNIYLSFYHFTSDDLNELGKLAVLMADRKLVLYVPEQMIDEFHRNREIKISQALSKFKEQKLNLQFPQLCKDYKEYQTLRSLQRTFETVHAELLGNMNINISEKTLKADKTIDMLFKQATHIPFDELVQKAKFRIETGKPPGKKGSLGDALNWESLIAMVPMCNDLYFVSDDGDYCSPLNDYQFNQYLLDEWQKNKASQIHFYKRLSSFFKEMFPDIKLSGELEKEVLIKRLANSSTFSQTHSVIMSLSRHVGFTTDQVNAILQAYVSNNQVYWILSDADVRGFIDSIVRDYQSVLDSDNLSKLTLLMGQKPISVDVEDDFEPPPF